MVPLPIPAAIAMSAILVLTTPFLGEDAHGGLQYSLFFFLLYQPVLVTCPAPVFYLTDQSGQVKGNNTRFESQPIFLMFIELPQLVRQSLKKPFWHILGRSIATMLQPALLAAVILFSNSTDFPAVLSDKNTDVMLFYQFEVLRFGKRSGAGNGLFTGKACFKRGGKG